MPTASINGGSILDKFLIFLLIGGALFTAFALHLAAKPRLASRLTLIATIVAVIGGLLIYGYGMVATSDSLILGFIRTILAVCCMFIGEIDSSILEEAPLFQSAWAQCLFWIINLIAFFATASAVVTTFGANALRKLRLWLSSRGELNVIFGLNENSLDFGKELMSRKNTMVVFVDSGSDIDSDSLEGCILRSDNSALNAEPRFLKSIGIRPGKRKVVLYTLNSDTAENLHYARLFLDALKERGIRPEQTSLIILGQENLSAGKMQVLGDKYGYGFVTAFQEPSLAARLLIQVCPPCDCISFDEDGKATEDFEAVIVGFGHVGQAVLKSLVMNGQFEGSRFKATVFSPDCREVNGYFTRSMQSLQEYYDISYQPFDARSQQMYDHFLQRQQRIKYVVVCTGSQKINQDISQELTDFFYCYGWKIPVFQCSHQGVKYFDPETQDTHYRKLYDPAVLSTGELDAMAMVINHYYQGVNSRGPLAEWMRCDYFSRMSSRASADFMGAMIRAAGKTAGQVLAGDWNLTPAQLETLSRTEHLRWCAFHYCMGFAPMSQEEYENRKTEYLRQKENGEATLRIGKNIPGRTHACLVSWEELDALSEKESRITGKSVNYKAMDTSNVLAVPDLLKIRHQAQ